MSLLTAEGRHARGTRSGRKSPELDHARKDLHFAGSVDFGSTHDEFNSQIMFLSDI
jgi:hypothetical protein